MILSPALGNTESTFASLDSYAPPSPFPWLTASPTPASSARFDGPDTASSSSIMMRTHNLSLGPPSPALSPRAGSTWGSQNLSLGSHAPGQTPSFPNSASGLRTPSGFEHLDFGADYFSLGERAQKKAPRSFEWEYWADWDQARTPELSPSPSPPVSPSRFAPSAPNPPSPSPGRLEVQQSLPPVSIKANDVLKRRLGPNEISYYLGSRGASPLDPLAGVNDM